MNLHNYGLIGGCQLLVHSHIEIAGFSMPVQVHNTISYTEQSSDDTDSQPHWIYCTNASSCLALKQLEAELPNVEAVWELMKDDEDQENSNMILIILPSNHEQ